MDTRASPPDSAGEGQRDGKETEKEIAQDARQQGVPAFNFPADATPEEKAAKARQVRCRWSVRCDSVDGAMADPKLTTIK